MDAGSFRGQGLTHPLTQMVLTSIPPLLDTLLCRPYSPYSALAKFAGAIVEN
jgi:hypothetical protein